MPQTFPRSFNLISRLSIAAAVFSAAALGGALVMLAKSPYVTAAGVPLLQPVPFSHAHHVGRLGFDCRHCHTSVEESSFAGIPPTKTCMNCHSQIWVGSTLLEPVRESYRSGQSLQWQRVHRLAQFVYFDHSIHVRKGVGCATCHGRVDEMPLTWQVHTLAMQWCLECHREPERFLRPRDEVFNMAWEPPQDQLALGRELRRKYRVRSLMNCSTCHR